MDVQEKKTNTYTKGNVIKNVVNESEWILKKIAEDTYGRTRISKKNYTAIVRNVYYTLEDVLLELLSSATPQTDVNIKLFEGISIGSTFVPEKDVVNNLTGNFITSSKKIRPKVTFTRNYRNKLTNHKK